MKSTIKKLYAIIRIDHTLNKGFSIIFFLFLGIVGRIAFPLLMELLNRPILEGNIKELSINLNMKDTWSVNTELQVCNTGKRETIIEIKNLLLFFPEFSKTPYHILIDTAVTLDKLTAKRVAIRGMFPNDFDTITRRPLLIKATVVFHDLNSSKYARIEKDTTDIKWQAMFGASNKDNEFSLSNNNSADENPYKNDSLTIDMFGTYELMYNMKRYTIRYYPNQHKMSHRIINGKIFLSPDIHLGYNDLVGGGRIDIPTSYQLITSKDIAGKIEIEEDYYLRLTSKKNKEDGIVEVTSYEFLTNDKKATIVYFFK